jgi:hypothetical protein
MIKQTGINKKTQATEAVAPVVGFLLIIAILFLAAGQYQANVVPQSEREAEISHFREVSDDFVGVQTQVVRSAQTGRLQSQDFKTGFRYGVIGVTNAPVAGQFQVSNRSVNGNDSVITIDNALNNGEASNFWRGNVKRSYNTSIVKYSVDYSRYQQNSDLYMEHGYVYGDFNTSADDSFNDESDRDLAGTQVDHVGITDQPIIQGRTITIYTVMAASSNNLSSSQRVGPTNVIANPTSAPMNSVSITNNGTDNVNITIPTRLDNETWKNNVIRNQMSSRGGTVEDVRQINQSHVKIVMEKDITYNLRMSRVTLDTQSSRNRIRTPKEQYVASSNPTINIRENSIVNLDAQVRDKFNNGVIGVPVSVEAQEASTGDGSGNQCIGDFRGQTAERNPRCNNNRGTVQPGIDTSDPRGDVIYTYEAPETDNDKQISFVYRIEDT